MIPLYLCDDDAALRSRLQRLCENTILMQGYGMRLALATPDPAAVLEALESNTTRGIYLLDVDLKNPEMDGFALATEIRRRDPRGFIVFVTTHAELAMETFRLRLEAMDYIVKDEPDRMEQRVAACLESIQQRLLEERVESSKVYTVKVLDEIHHIPVPQILYFETSGQKHRLLLHADTTVLEFFGNLQSIEEAVGAGFWRCHRSYLVNRERVRTIHLRENLVELEGGAKVPLSRKAKKALGS